MRVFAELQPYQNFCSLPAEFYRQVNAQGLSEPELVIVSESCARLLDIDPASLNTTSALAILSGKTHFTHTQPLAMKYTGHQFGYYNPELGDGRGLLLGDIRGADSTRSYDLHLKGAGTTPFSRQGDGRAVLRSSIREFLASEALAALGIPTTRALCLLNSQTPVQREQLESAASLLRVTPSHIRFGHFEFAFHTGNKERLKTLCDYTIQRHYPCLASTANAYADFFKLSAQKTASLVAQWQVVGFAHGVMNTDNMSILGETFDYGPYGFLDKFKPGHICNHSDHSGRYAFNKQPAIAHWNLSVLAHALSPLIEKEALSEGLHAYNEQFNQGFLTLMRAKLGLSETRESDQGLIFELFNMMAENQLDYSHFFRDLSHAAASSEPDFYIDYCLNRESYQSLINSLLARWLSEEISPQERSARMLKCNPKYILRNHLAQQAIEQAQQGDYSEVQRLARLLAQPFEEQEAYKHYAQLPPESAEQLSISCSS